MQCLWIGFLFQKLISSTHKILPCDCKICDCTFRNMALLSIHMKACHVDVDNPDPFVPDLSTSVPYHACHNCDEMFALNSSFERHILQFHNDRATFRFRYFNH